MFDIRELRYFLQVATQKSFTKAANILCITQPTLSRTIQDLEYELKHKLFKRTAHGVQLTHEGILFEQKAREIVELVEKTTSDFVNLNKNISGTVRIGAGETLAFRSVAKAMQRLKEEHPNIDYKLSSYNSYDVVNGINSGTLDFGLVIEPFDLTDYEYIELDYKEKWGVICKKGSELSKKTSIKITDLVGLPLIVSHQALNNKGKNSLSEALGDEVHNLNFIISYNLLYNAGLLCYEGLGYIIGIDNIITNEDSECFDFIPFEGNPSARTYIVWKKKSKMLPAPLTFLQTMQKMHEGHEL